MFVFVEPALSTSSLPKPPVLLFRMALFYVNHRYPNFVRYKPDFDP